MRVLNSLGFRLSGRGDTFINTMIFTKNGYARAFTSPNQPNTTAQGMVKAIFALISSSWLTLTLTAQQIWDSAAAGGDWKVSDSVSATQVNLPSGKALFQHLNGNILNAGGTLIEVVPTKAASGTTYLSDDGIAFISALGEVDEVNIVYGGTLSANEVHVIELTPALPAGTSVLRTSKLRKIDTNTDTSPFNVAATYITKFGSAMNVGEKVGYRIKAVNKVTGQSRPVGEGLVVTTL